MTQPTANCPNCGAKIVFRWSSSVQTVCEYCKSILVRTDIDLKKVGQGGGPAAEQFSYPDWHGGRLQPSGLRGRWPNHLRIRSGNLERMALVMNNGSAWLSDAQNEYVVTFAGAWPEVADRQAKSASATPGTKNDYTVTTITKAHYPGLEGELPFQYWDKNDVVFVDLMSTNGKFATHRLQRRDSCPVPGGSQSNLKN